MTGVLKSAQKCSTAPKRATTHSTNQPPVAGFEAAVTGFYVYVTVGLAAGVEANILPNERKQIYWTALWNYDRHDEKYL